MSIQSFTGRLTSSRRGAILLGVGAAVLAAVLLAVYISSYRDSVESGYRADAGARRQATDRAGHARLGDRGQAAVRHRPPSRATPSSPAPSSTRGCSSGTRGRDRHLPGAAAHDRPTSPPARPSGASSVDAHRQPACRHDHDRPRSSGSRQPADRATASTSTSSSAARRAGHQALPAQRARSCRRRATTGRRRHPPGAVARRRRPALREHSTRS